MGYSPDENRDDHGRWSQSASGHNGMGGTPGTHQGHAKSVAANTQTEEFNKSPDKLVGVTVARGNKGEIKSIRVRNYNKSEQVVIRPGRIT